MKWKIKINEKDLEMKKKTLICQRIILRNESFRETFYFDALYTRRTFVNHQKFQHTDFMSDFITFTEAKGRSCIFDSF